MRHFVFVIALFHLTIISFGQSLFFDSLKNSIWTTEKQVTESGLKSSREISLTKTSDQKKLQTDKTMWVFSDSLDIGFYSAKSHCLNPFLTFSYVADKDKGLLKIILSDKSTLTYKVGIDSTGNSVLLTRQDK